jgi:hypothetical protein
MEIPIDYLDVNDFLSRCSDDMMRYIELQTAFAKDVRTYMLEYSVSDDEFAKEFGCDIEQVRLLRCGGCDISLRDMARLRTLYATRIAEDNANLKLASK